MTMKINHSNSKIDFVLSELEQVKTELARFRMNPEEIARIYINAVTLLCQYKADLQIERDIVILTPALSSCEAVAKKVAESVLYDIKNHALFVYPGTFVRPEPSPGYHQFMRDHNTRHLELCNQIKNLTTTLSS